MNDNTNTPGCKRPITVTVTGDQGAGKTTLIAVIAQALENSGHRVQVPKHTPNATTAIADLHEQFDIRFEERAPMDDVVDALQDAGLRAVAVNKAATLFREVAYLDLDRKNLRRQVDEINANCRKLAEERDARELEAMNLLRTSVGLSPLPPKSAAVDSRSAAERLEAANAAAFVNAEFGEGC